MWFTFSGFGETYASMSLATAKARRWEGLASKNYVPIREISTKELWRLSTEFLVLQNEAGGLVVSTEASIKSIPKARWIRIIPPTIIIYIIAYMDRMNVSFAIAGGMSKELEMSMAASGLAAGIFFFGYLVLQVPGGYLAEHKSAKRFILWSIIGWGLTSMLTGLAQNEWQLLAARFALGVAEGGVFPAVLVILSNWFPRSEIGRANALFVSSMAISSAVTNPFSGWIVYSYGWRYLFFIEGGVSLLLIFIWLPLISDRPAEAKWISKEEKEYLVNTLAAEKAEAASNMTAKNWTFRQMLTDKTLWIMVVSYICFTAGQNGYSMWLPTILKDLTSLSLANVGFLASIPFIVAIGGTYIFGSLTDRFGNPRFYAAVVLWCFSGFLFLSMQFPGKVLLSFGLLVITGGFLKAYNAPFWSMQSLVFPAGMAGASRGVINALGNLGGFIGPFFVGWISSSTGDMKYGVYSLVALLAFGGCTTMLLPAITARKKRNAPTGIQPVSKID
ncbi:MAG: MFS transporter [Negativicutes bacterium]|nr:MFS transporter [Negativicutes bacterium]